MNNDKDKNYYEVLEVASNATLQEVHNAYVRVKNAYSGDTAALYSIMTQNECEDIVNQIEEAYTILGVPEKRREYDIARGFNQVNTQDGFNESIQEDNSLKRNFQLSDDDIRAGEQRRMQESQESRLREEFTYKEGTSEINKINVSKIQAINKFKLDYKKNENFEQEIENCEKFTGDFLKQVREYKNVSIERMAEMTKISKTYIKTIEADDYKSLPAVVYTRGFVYQYAKCLKLNPNHIATSYMNHIKELKLETNA